jgi:lysophospholipase L1-like esterase
MKTAHIIIGIAVCLLAFRTNEKKIRIFLAGDSTMCEYPQSRTPLTGWGMPFAGFFDSSVRIENKARGGRSTRTFISEGRWKELVDQVSEGDFVMIQFGHNDEAKEEKYKDRYTSVQDYTTNLELFVKETRAHKGLPILVTPVSRLRFGKDGRQEETHAAYTSAMLETGKRLSVPVINLDSLSIDLYNHMGEKNAPLLFMQLAPGEDPHYPDGQKDNTHFNEYGARKMASLVWTSFLKWYPDMKMHLPPGIKPSLP